MVLYVTGILLAAGALLLLLFEWNGILAELSIPGKLVNAFFLSASARTAGFSTVSLAGINLQSFMIIIFLMFVGGSPGGSAGGVKTTTIAVLFFTFGAALRNRDTVTVGGWKIAHRTVIQAVAIVMAALMILFLTMLMLTATQDIPAGKMFFEAVSALSTTGLSLDTTGLLDAVGKIIVIIAMFIGRVGPLTLFLLFSDRSVSKQPGYPPVNIPLG
jgi:trk system potassium uptake protein TrkH